MRFREALKISQFLLLGSFFTATSILSLVGRTWEIGLPALLLVILNNFDETVEIILYPVRLIFEILFYIFSIDLEFQDGWSTLFAILALKMAFDFRVDFGQKRYFFCIIEIVIGTICFVVVAVFLASSTSSSFALYGAPAIVSMLAYEILRSVIASFMYPYPNQSFLDRLAYRQKHYAGIVLASGMFSVASQLILLRYGVSDPAVGGFLLFILFLGIFSVVDAAIVALFSPDAKIQVFIDIQRRKLGLALIYSFLIAFLLIVAFQIV